MADPGREKKTAGVGALANMFSRDRRTNAFFALTVRSDDAKRLMMGQAVLKSHVVGSRYYTPDGDYGEERADGLVMPTNDAGFLDRLCRDFSISGETNRGFPLSCPGWTRKSREKLSCAR